MLAMQLVDVGHGEGVLFLRRSGPGQEPGEAVWRAFPIAIECPVYCFRDYHSSVHSGPRLRPFSLEDVSRTGSRLPGEKFRRSHVPVRNQYQPSRQEEGINGAALLLARQ